MTRRDLALLGAWLLCIDSCWANIVFTVSPSSTSLLIGSQLSLDCVATDVPHNRPITYQWEFENASIYDNIPQAFIFTNSSLFISRLTQNELGTYACVAQVAGEEGTAVRSADATVIEAYIEDIYLQSTDLAITEGSTATLTCVTGRSAPPAIVSWLLDGAEFTAGSQETATFGNIGEGGAARVSAKLEFIAAVEYSGLFQCRAHNVLLQQSVSSDEVNVTVYRIPVAPSFISEPQSDIAAAGVPYSLDCSSRGFPDPTVSWTKDGQEVAYDERLVLLQNGSLHFNPLEEDTNDGTYVCSATNSEGSIVSNPVDLTVAYLAIDFPESPADLSAVAGEPVSLPCAAPVSVPPADVIWYKDDEPLEERSGPFAVENRDGHLVFASVQLSDVGVYVCVAVNDHSLPSTRASAAASLAITAAPQLIEPPIPTSVVKGDLFRLTCLVDGNPMPSVTWYHDAQLIIADATTTFGNLNQELIVSNANKLDEGRYHCEAVNHLGTKSSNQVMVTVIIPPEITVPLGEISVPEGSSVIMPCVVYGDPEPAITWYHDDILVEYSSKVFANVSGLVITDVDQRDEGDYRCEVTNTGGMKDTEGSLHIQVKASIHQGPDDQTVLVGRSVILQCLGVGQPLPEYTWNFNSSLRLPPGVTLSSTRAAIIITSAQREHTGIYTCIASNSVGEDSASASLVVHEKPVVVLISGSHTVNQGSDLDLTCVVTGIPRPIILWEFAGVLVVPSPDGRISFPELDSLRVRFMTGQDAGDYECIAENAVGEASLVASVVVRQTPLPPTLRSVKPVSMTSINVTWEAPLTDPNRDISAYVIEYTDRSPMSFAPYPRQIPASSTSYEVGGLEPYTYYSFRVAAENSLGRGEFSSVLEARTLETVHANVVGRFPDRPLRKRSRRQVGSDNVNSSLPLAPSQPRNLQLLYHNATAVSLEWEVPEQTNGQIRTYQLHYRAKFTNDVFSIVAIDLPTFPQQKYTLGGVTPYTTYEFKVRGATIEQGVTLWGAFSNLLDITTSPLAPSASPEYVRGLAVSPSVLRITWQALPSNLHNGPLSGYLIKYRKSGTSDAFSVVAVNATTLQMNLTGLLPWQTYEVQVYAYNVVGESDPATTLTIRTQPIAPSDSPVNLQVVAISPSVLAATWQPVPANDRNSEISGYMLEYAPGGAAPSTISIGSAGILTANISDLQPYTRYDVRIRAFTTQVTNGFSPYGNTVAVTTLEAAPGPVSGLTGTPLPYGLVLSWSPPEQPNGVVRLYHVTYGPGGLDGSPDSEVSLHRDVASSSTTLKTSETNITILDLIPSTDYRFSVAAETGAGIGIQPASIVINNDLTTLASPTITNAETTENPSTAAEVTPSVVSTTAAAANLDDNDLPLIIGAAVAGGIALVLLIILIAVLCRRRQKKKSGVYFIPPMAFKRQSLAEISQNAYNTDLPQTQSSDRRRSSSSDTYRSTSHHSLRPSTDSSVAQRHLNGRNHMLPPGATHGAYAADVASMDELHLAHIPDDWLRDIVRPSQSLQGLDNPGFVSEGARGSSNIPSSVHSFRRPPYTSSTELFGNVNISKRHHNRMHSEAAAAIAAQKNRDTSVFDDTDMLIDDSEVVVVYNERTAL